MKDKTTLREQLRAATRDGGNYGRRARVLTVDDAHMVATAHAQEVAAASVEKFAERFASNLKGSTGKYFAHSDVDLAKDQALAESKELRE